MMDSLRAVPSLPATLGVVLLVSCSSAPDSPAPLRVVYAPAGDSTRLTLVPSAGFRINARLKPALELPDGTVLRFDSPSLTADSAYFAEPPSASMAGPRHEAKGTLRASICGKEPACRGVVLKL
jgi:hypothetical protein